jgi:hypothetical protein
MNAEKRNLQTKQTPNQKNKPKHKKQNLKKGSLDKPLNVSTTFKQQVCLFIEVRSARGIGRESKQVKS